MMRRSGVGVLSPQVHEVLDLIDQTGPFRYRQDGQSATGSSGSSAGPLAASTPSPRRVSVTMVRGGSLWGRAATCTTPATTTRLRQVVR